MMTNLRLTHLRFDCQATTLIKLGGHYAGNALRNALANVMRRATCPETQRRGDPSPEHVATCPACWLLAANLDPGTVIRAYTLIPPILPIYELRPGDTFTFGLTLVGDGFQYLPYFVLAVMEMGQREGIGPGRREGIGRFELAAITAVHPFHGEAECILAPNEHLVQVPTLHVDWATVAPMSQHYTPPNNELTIHFHTPIRLIEKGRLFKTPDFSVFFRRLLFRIDELNRQLAHQERRAGDEVKHLHALADQVRLLETNTQWHEMWVHSGRKGRKTPLSGFTGTAVYWAEDWTALLPYLVWGQGTQVGKSTAKGNGVYELVDTTWPRYWDWMRQIELGLVQKDSV